MNIVLILFQLAIVVIGPIYMIGIINRVKSLWAGRRGPRLNQSWFDLLRLLRKTPVYSVVTTWIFPLAPIVILASTITASLFVPLVPGFAPYSFTGDFVAFLYLLGLGKVFLMLGALDTGSAFEGMGASREATYSALAEPVIMLTLGTLILASGHMSFSDLVIPQTDIVTSISIRIALAAVMFIVLLIETSRVPADDPTTHLELTMVHEVMILDHSGPELAIVQYAAGIKMVLLAGLISALLNPFSFTNLPVLAMFVSATLIALVAVLVGLTESLTARLRFRAIPLFTFAAFLISMICLVLVHSSQGTVQ